MNHYPYPSIGQFKDVVRAVNRRRSRPLSPLEYVGTVKLHGTNAALVGIFERDIGEKGWKLSSFYTQSRNRVLSLESDNCGFQHFISGKNQNEIINKLFEPLLLHIPIGNKEQNEEEKKIAIIIYGEFCGLGIQRGVAISALEKMFVIFDARAKIMNETIEVTNEDNEENEETTTIHLSLDESLKITNERIFNIYQFPHQVIHIDMNDPASVQNELVEKTMKVEKECPVGKYFNVLGVGEGIVWKCKTEGFRSSQFTFKVKGSEHSVTKVKTLKELAPIDVEKMANVAAFVEKTVTENRLKQGIDYVQEMQGKVTIHELSTFLRWLIADIMKEEGSSIEKEMKNEANKKISGKAREYYVKYIENMKNVS